MSIRSCRPHSLAVVMHLAYYSPDIIIYFACAFFLGRRIRCTQRLAFADFAAIQFIPCSKYSGTHTCTIRTQEEEKTLERRSETRNVPGRPPNNRFQIIFSLHWHSILWEAQRGFVEHEQSRPQTVALARCHKMALPFIPALPVQDDKYLRRIKNETRNQKPSPNYDDTTHTHSQDRTGHAVSFNVQ